MVLPNSSLLQSNCANFYHSFSLTSWLHLLDGSPPTSEWNRDHYRGYLSTYFSPATNSPIFHLVLFPTSRYFSSWKNGYSYSHFGLPDSSVGKESTCNTGDPGLILGLGRSTGKGKGYPLQYSWASLMAQLIKNPPAMQETWVWSMGWEDPLEKGKATHSSILAWRIPRDGKESDTTKQLSLHFTSHSHFTF